jgi:hypothetical protein
LKEILKEKKEKNRPTGAALRSQFGVCLQKFEMFFKIIV